MNERRNMRQQDKYKGNNGKWEERITGNKEKSEKKGEKWRKEGNGEEEEERSRRKGK